MKMQNIDTQPLNYTTVDYSALPRLTDRFAQAISALLENEIEISVSLAGNDLHLACDFRNNTAIGDCLEVGFSLNGRPISFLIEKRCISQKLDANGHSLVIDELERTALALVVEHLFTDMLEHLSSEDKIVVKNIEIRTPDDNASGDTLWFRLDAAGVSGMLGLRLGHSDLLLELIRALQEPKQSWVTPHLLVPCSLQSLPIAMEAKQVELLRKGDLILLEQAWASFTEFRVIVYGKQICLVKEDSEDVCVTSLLASNYKESFPVSSEAEKVDVGSVPVTLSIELDRKNIRYSDLEMLQPGSIIGFSSEKPEIVRLLANGSKVADCELLKIENKVGVRILRIE